jgi:serine/threonine protein kinase/Flp pilus assembly protein TadD
MSGGACEEPGAGDLGAPTPLVAFTPRPADATARTLNLEAPTPVVAAVLTPSAAPSAFAVANSRTDTLPEGATPETSLGRGALSSSGRLRFASRAESATVRGTTASIAFRGGVARDVAGGAAPSGDGEASTLRDAEGRWGGPEGAGTGTLAARGAADVIAAAGAGASGASATATFSVVRTLGQGGMGVVYAAAQESLDREVALKMIRPEVGRSSDAERRFVDEALVTARLDHPNVVSVYDLGRDARGDLFIAMKLVRGVSWQALISPRDDDAPELRERARFMTLRDHLEILLKVCDAVAFAHARGVVHRDLKPDNVMVGAFGEVLVMDWGLALDVTPEARAARGAADFEPPCGTPCYMPPELAKGDLARQGAATDVYLLGGIVYRLITGAAPHAGHDVRVVLALAAEGKVEPAAERARAKGRVAPGPLAAIAAKALDPEPSRRYAGVADLAAAVREFLRNEGASKLAEAAIAELASVERRIAQEPDARPADVYASLAAVVAELVQSLKLWEKNRDAADALHRARLATARYALARGDVGTAEAHLALVPDDAPDRAEVARLLGGERAARACARARRRRIMALLAVLVVCAVGAAVWSLLRAREAEATKARRAEAVKLVEGFYWESQDQRIDAYERAIRIDPTWAEGRMEAAWAMMGRAYERAIQAPDGGKVLLDFAIGHFDEATRLVPDDPSKLAERGYLHEVRGEVEKALADYRRSVALDPNSALGTSCRGSLLAYEGKLEEAERALNASIALREYSSAVLLRGLVRYARGDLDGAEDDLARYLKSTPEDEWGHSFAALLHLARGRDREAAEELITALRGFPRGPHALPLLAAYTARRGDLERARAVLARAKESQETYRTCYALLEITWRTASLARDPHLARLGKALLCEGDLAAFSPPAPPETIAVRRRGEEKLAAGDVAGALADATLALSDDPCDSGARILRARALGRLGRGAAAADDIEVAVLVAPERAEEIERARREAGLSGARERER